MKQSWFFEKINNINKLQQDEQRKKKRKFSNIRNETGNFPADPAYMKRIVREYYEQLYMRRFDNLEAIN